MKDITYILFNKDLNKKKQIIYFDKGSYPNKICVDIRPYNKINCFLMIITTIKLNPFKTNKFCYLEEDIDINNLFPNNNKIYYNDNLSVIFGDKKELIKINWELYQEYILKNENLFIKTINKLENMPNFLWINLDRSLDRKNYMENLFKTHNLKNIRISGFDGVKTNNFYKPSLNYPGNIYGATCSHLKALEYFVTELKDEYCFICEDDLSFEYCEFWKQNFNNYLNTIPKDWELILFNVNTTYPMTLTPTKFVLDRYHSAGCYLIKKEAARKILNAPFFSKRENKYIFNFKKRVDITADKCLYKYLNNVYVLPLFTYKNDNSVISNNKGRLSQHQRSKDKILKLWKNSF